MQPQPQIRNTGKFKPFQYIIDHTFTTSSTIKVPQHTLTTTLKSIQWRRKFEDLVQKLYHLDGCAQYVCTELDKDFLIEALLENQVVGGVEGRVNVYGPVLGVGEAGLNDGGGSENQVFQVQILSHKKSYFCTITFLPTQILLRNKTNPNQLSIPTSDLINCYVHKINGTQVVIFPTLFLRIIVLKLFNQILSKGTYSDNNDPVMLKIYDQNEENPRVRAHVGWKRFLLRLNFVKQDHARRMSMPPIQYSNNNIKLPILEPEYKKSQYARYSQDNVGSASISQKKGQEHNLKKSENLQRNKNQKNDKKNSNIMKSESDLPESDNPYFAEFQNLIYEEDQPQKQAIELNNSFEQFQKKSRSQKQIQKMKYVKAKKKLRQAQTARRRQLEQTLQQLLQKRNDLIATNNKLKYELQIQKNQNYSSSINAAKAQLFELRAQYQRLTEENGRKSQDNRRGYGVNGGFKI